MFFDDDNVLVHQRLDRGYDLWRADKNRYSTSMEAAALGGCDIHDGSGV